MKPNNNKHEKVKKMFIIFALLLFVIDTIITTYACLVISKIKSERVISIAKTATVAYFKDVFSKLDLNESDLDKDEYFYVKSSLVKIKNINKDAKMAYIYTERDGKIRIAADSEALLSPEYSPPGEELKNMNPSLVQYVRKGGSLVTKPTPDKFGVWVTVVVPIQDTNNNVIAAFCMDYPAAQWNKEIINQITLSVLVLGIVYLAIYKLYQLIIALDKN